jgi:peroxiredoxin
VFFPAAFTGTCQRELTTFQDRLGRFKEAGAQVLGISVDSPLVLSEFRERQGIGFPLISDLEREIIHAYDMTEDFPDYEIEDLAARAIVVVGTDRRVRWTWRGDPGEEPDYAAVAAAVAGLPETEGISTGQGETDL